MTQVDAPRISEIPFGETYLAHQAMRVLRTAAQGEQQFVSYVDGTLRPQGYRLIGSFVPAAEQAAAVAGFHVADSLALGHFLYLDDLTTVPDARRHGHARALVDWLVKEARRLKCAQLHLDAVVGPERFDAHRFYHANGLSIYAHHFTRDL